jgi:hypothetical protein
MRGNGHRAAEDRPLASFDEPAPSDFVEWRVAGTVYRVPCLTLWHYDHPEIKDALDGLRFTTRIDYAKECHALLTAILRTEHREGPDIQAVLKEQPLFGDLPVALVVAGLLEKSGYRLAPGEQQAASPGIGTLTGSSPDLPLAVSAEAIPGASAEPSP